MIFMKIYNKFLIVMTDRFRFAAINLFFLSIRQSYKTIIYYLQSNKIRTVNNSINLFIDKDLVPPVKGIGIIITYELISFQNIKRKRTLLIE